MNKSVATFGAVFFTLIAGTSAYSNNAKENVPLLEAAAAPYVMLRDDIADIEGTGIDTSKDVRAAHHKIMSHDPAKLTQAYMAYAALVAADVEAFHKGIERRTRRSSDRRKFLRELQTNPAMVRQIKGADKAIEAILDMSARDASRIAALGQTYVDRAYEMEKLAWAKKRLKTKGMSRVNEAVKWANARPWPSYEARPAIRSKAGNVRPNLMADEQWAVDWSTKRQPPRADSKSGMLMSQALVLAVHYTMGTLEESHLREYAHSRPTNRCLINTKLGLDGCIAATRSTYEETFCLGKQGFNPVSRCIGWPASAGAAK